MRNRQAKIAPQEIQKLRRKFSVDELKAIILLRFNNNLAKKEELEQRIAEEAYSPIIFTSFDALGGTIRDLTAEWISKTYAGKLKSTKNPGAFLTDDDYLKCVGHITRTLGSNRPDPMYRSAFFLGAVYLKDSFEEVKFQIGSVEDPSCDPYEENWRWVKAVIEEAQSWELSPAEVLKMPVANDGIFRRLFSREAFEEYCERAFRFTLNSNTSDKKYIERVAKIYIKNSGITDPKEKKIAEKAFIERELAISERIAKEMKTGTDNWIREEVVRIYS